MIIDYEKVSIKVRNERYLSIYEIILRMMMFIWIIYIYKCDTILDYWY